MVSTRSKLKRKKPLNETLDPTPANSVLETVDPTPTTSVLETLDPAPATNIFRTLISALESPQNISSSMLRSSYYVLIKLSSIQQTFWGKGADVIELGMKTREGEVRVTSSDICRLFDILFKELQKRLKQLHSWKHDVSAAPSLDREELNLLIRCCMVILTLCLPQKHLLEGGRVLLQIFKKLSLLEIAGGCDENVFKFKISCSCQDTYGGEDSSDSFANVASLSSLELFATCIPLLTAILEVLIDELLVHGQLRKYLQMIDSLSPANEWLFDHGSNRGNFGIVIDMICSHFSMSISDEGALHEFLHRMTWTHSKKFEASELSVIAARTLLQNSFVIYFPKLLQAHIISLVSDVICEKPRLDPRLIDCYLSVFQTSVILYTQHMSSLEIERHPVGGRDPLVNLNNGTYDPFESCIESTKRQKLNHLMTRLNDSWNSNLKSVFFKTKSDLLTSSAEYIEENGYILDVRYRDEVLSFLRCILRRAVNDINDIELPLNGDASLQDICLLASLLKLMSNSLIQAVWCLRHPIDKKCPKTLEECKEYDFIVGIMRCFKEFSIRLPIQKFSSNKMDTHPVKHKESRVMLLHFLGLLSLSFDSGLDFLVKSCISTIMALANLLVLEEGNMDVLKSLADIGSSPYDGCLAIYKEALVCQDSTLGVTSNFQKTQTHYVSKESVASDLSMGAENLSNALTAPLSMKHVVAIEDEETCSGEIYLKRRFKGSGGGDTSDLDDLAGFVECKKGKDYGTWLKSREKFREWKLGKRVKRRWEKKMLAWKSMMRELTGEKSPESPSSSVAHSAIARFGPRLTQTPTLQQASLPESPALHFAFALRWLCTSPRHR